MHEPNLRYCLGICPEGEKRQSGYLLPSLKFEPLPFRIVGIVSECEKLF